MSLEAAIQENTATMRELIAALTAAGALQTAQASAQAASSPAVKAVVKAQKELAEKEATDAKKSDKKETTPETKSGEASTDGQATESASADAGELLPWADKTAELHAKLKDLDPNFANLKEAVLGINRIVGRAQAEAILARFGAEAITTKADKKGLDENQYPAVFEMCIEVLAGRADATASME